MDSLFVKTGVFMGGIIIGYIANRFSISLGWMVGGIILAASSILFLKLPQKQIYSGIGSKSIDADM